MKILKALIVVLILVASYVGTFFAASKYEWSRFTTKYIEQMTTNHCLQDALIMRDYLKERNFEASVLVFVFIPQGSTQPAGHAVCVYESNGVWYAWDQSGSSFIKPTVNSKEALELAKAVESTAIIAHFIK